MSYVRGDIQVLGLEELDQIMAQLPRKLNNKLIYSALRSSANIFIRRARGLIAGYSQRHAKALGTRKARQTKFPTIWAGHIFTKNPAAFFPHWLEYGTEGIKKKKSPGSTYRPTNPAFAWVGRLARGTKYRDPQKPHPYIRPAWDTTGEQVSRDFTEKLKRTIESTLRRYAKKHGFR